MASLLDLVSSHIGSDGIERIAGQLGVDSGTAQQAVQGALPLLMGALAKNASSPDGAAALHGALERDHDGGILEQLSGFLGGGGGGGMGDAILGHVLGGRRGHAEAGLSRATGLDLGQAGKLLAILAPIVMGALGKQRRQEGLDPSGLAGILASEREQARQQPQGGLGALAGILDMDGDGNPMDDIARIGGNLLGGLFGDKR